MPWLPPQLEAASSHPPPATGKPASLGTRQERYKVLLSCAFLNTDGASTGNKARGNSETDRARIGTLNLQAGVNPTDNLEFNLNGWYASYQTEFDNFLGGVERGFFAGPKTSF